MPVRPHLVVHLRRSEVVEDRLDVGRRHRRVDDRDVGAEVGCAGDRLCDGRGCTGVHRTGSREGRDGHGGGEEGDAPAPGTDAGELEHAVCSSSRR